MEHGAKAHLKNLAEYFSFLFEFSRMGDEEAKFLIAVGAIHMMVQFYLGNKLNDLVSIHVFLSIWSLKKIFKILLKCFRMS